MLSDLLFNHPLVCAVAVTVVAYTVAAAVILRSAR